MTPYASILIPTHDRASTLAASLRSALGQSVENIEVLICGDGVTDDVREIASGFAERDARVRFLDFPKAPRRGAINMHRTLEEARSDRIFYNDDDDLLLPWHVETLGPALDEADFVCTPPASIQTDGRIALSLEDASHPALRRMLADDKYKNVFDTHIAHRKSGYFSNRANWENTPDRRAVSSMLKGFAENRNIRWKNLQRITALSFHGAVRTGMPARKRTGEIERWVSRLDRPNPEAMLRRRGSYVFHTMRLFQALRKAGLFADDALLAEIFGNNRNKAELTSSQNRGVDAVEALTRHEPVPQKAGRQLIEELADARLGPLFPVNAILHLFLGSMKRSQVLAFAGVCTPDPSIHLLRFHLLAGQKRIRPAEIRQIDLEAKTLPDWRRFYFRLSVVEALEKAERPDDAWVRCEKMLKTMPEGTYHALPYLHVRERLAFALEHMAEAQNARTLRETLEKTLA